MKKKILSFVCVFSLLVCFALTACSSQSAAGIWGAKINDNGELVLIYHNGAEQNLGVVVGKDGVDGTDGKDGSVTVDSGAGGVSLASAKGLRSAVSIVCKFQANILQGGWRPGSGSTTTKSYSSGGSGVIYQLNKAEGDAFIITNHHVVYDASSNTENGISNDISVYLYGSASEANAIKATYVGGSLYYDIAVLRVENSELLKNSDACAVGVTDSDTIAVGDTALAIGNAKGYGISVSSGIVSVDSEYITMTASDERTEVSFRVMRVDAAINSGNSGGGLFDAGGNLIGIVNAKIVADGVENIGYAIPSNVAVAIADNIIDYCYGTDTERVQRAMLGITVNASGSKAVYNAETGRMTIEETVSVDEVSKGSLAEGVLKEGDIFLSMTLAGEKSDITRQYQVIDLMLDVRVGDVVKLNILRNGENRTVEIAITEDCLTAY